MKSEAVDFGSAVYFGAPEGWRSAEDWTEVFLLVAAMELHERRLLNPSAPFDERVHSHLDPMYQFDPFRSLITDGEPVGRLPLLNLVWKLVEIKLAETFQVSSPNPYLAHQHALRQLTGTKLGPHGTFLFLEAFKRRWFDVDGLAELTEGEVAFVEGRPVDLGTSVLPPSGHLYMDSIWLVAFRIVEAQNPRHYISQYSQRLQAVRQILIRGAELGLEHAPNLWPGWPGYLRP